MVRKNTAFWEPGLIIPVALLVIIGAATVYSATVLSRGGDDALFIRHIGTILLGGILGFLLAWLPPRILEDLSPWLYLIALASLILVLFAGEMSHGARRWLAFGSIRFQPSEPAKIAVILYLGRFLASKRCDLRRFWQLAGGLAIAGVPFLLVLKEPDLGTSLSFVVIALGMLIVAGLPWLTLFTLVSPVVVTVLSLLDVLIGVGPKPLGIPLRILLWILFVGVGVLLIHRRRVGWLLVGLFAAFQIGIAVQAPRLWDGLEEYQQARLKTFIHPEREPAGAGYQVIQSKIAIGSGCATGQGFGRGSQKALAFLPRQHTDFIYSVVGEEGGFLAGMGVLLLFGVLLLRGLALARRVRSRFGSIVASGVISMIFYHAAVNIAMTLGLAPVTGLPLPFMSFGGSFMLTVLGAAGLLLGITARRTEY
ncbi:MAG: rod shape-determining protein RodA [Candidatus Eisenbacteria sp.]|nr:rod shape-determining protein RodA [Candidatus Eisenbacteria bacterium]